MDILAPLGRLHPDEDIEQWLVTEPITIAFLDNQALNFTLIDIAEDPAPAEFVDAIKTFLAQPSEAKQQAEHYLYLSYRHMLNELDEFERDEWDLEINEPEQIWEFIDLQRVYISRRQHGDKAVHISVQANCEWEPEHGVQLVYSSGSTLVRVSGQDGHLTNTDAYNLDDDQDQILYQLE